MSDAIHIGWMERLDLPAGYYAVDSLLPPGASVLLSALDRHRKPAELPRVRERLTALDIAFDVLGDCLVLTREAFERLLGEDEYFTGFDEVWVFDGPPSAPPPTTVTLASDGSVPAGCILGLEDGYALSFAARELALVLALRERAVAAGDLTAMRDLAPQYGYELDRGDDARRIWDIAIEQGDALSMFDLGFFLWFSDDFDGAADAFQLAIDAGSPRGHMEMGFLLSDNERDMEAALAAFERAQEAGVGGASLQVGWQLARLGRLDEAEPALRRACGEGYMEAGDILHDVLENLGRPEEAERVLEETTEWAASHVSLDYRDLLGHALGEELTDADLTEFLEEEHSVDVTPREVAALLFDAARLSEATTRLEFFVAEGSEEAAEFLAELRAKTGRAP